MSLRQRQARMSAESKLKPSEHPPDSLSANSNGTAPPTSQPRKGIRLNRVLGRIVPIILLVYIAYTYDFVVIRYAYRYLHLEQKRTLAPICWLLPAHGLFLWSLRSYLRVFFAHDHLARRSSRGIEWLRARLGATFPDPDESRRQDNHRIAQRALTLLPGSASCTDVRIELCQPNGQLLRCWRDSCNGQPKTLRTRHCGDCGTCRIGLDHHCAWFDNDVTAATTLRPFVGVLVSVPPLYALALGPLFPTAWRVLVRVQAFSHSDDAVRSAWWSKWYSWVGGPGFRWMVGFALGAARWSRSTMGRMPHESPRAPIIVAVGAVFVFVAAALASSSLMHLRMGRLTVDVERAKAFRRLQRHLGRVENSQAEVDAIRLKMDALAPVQHFKVSWVEPGSAERQSSVVSLTQDEGLLSHGHSWTNVRRLLGAVTDESPAWSISDTALRKVLEKASLLSPAQ